MCGIVGFWGFAGPTPNKPLAAIAEEMTGPIEHRGPDSSGVWVDEEARLGFGHRRLSILDLSPAGHQPMVSQSGRSVICYNGEVYNAPELRADLESAGHRFRGHSDTEVILAACEAWGVEAATKRLIGMFAFALWRRDERTLTLVRDRVGIKPLYWGVQGGTAFFASQIKSLYAYPGFKREIDRDALATYFRFSSVPAPLCILAGIRQLQPGYLVEIDNRGRSREICYWNAIEIAERSFFNQQTADDATLLDELDHLLRDAVGRSMASDVPLGAFLSGGIDSSAVVAFMQQQSTRPIQTFTIGFTQQAFDESHHASAVAKHLGTDHHHTMISDADLLGTIPSLQDWYDEPFGDSSEIPTLLVSQMTRRHVTVALSGDGGDELFAGYDNYFKANKLARLTSMMPRSVRHTIAAGIRAVPAASWGTAAAMMRNRSGQLRLRYQLEKSADLLTSPSPDRLFRDMASHWRHPVELVPGATEPALPGWNSDGLQKVDDYLMRMQVIDLIGYLPGLLTKVDRASMAVSLESRVPLLDHRVIEFAWRLPRRAKVRNGKGKWLLRQLVARYVPASIIERPKKGFSVPLHAWLRGPLRAWAEALLDPRALAADGLLNPQPFRRRWEEHLSGRHNWAGSLWGILMFQAWRQHWMTPGRS